MRKMINEEHIEGRIYQHNLALKRVQRETSANFGKNFIQGDIEIATDEEGLNVIPVHFSYTPEFTKSNNKSSTYATLLRIIEEGKTWIEDGKDEATKVRIDTSLALNDFYAKDDENRLISAKRNEGGFVTIVNELCDLPNRNRFTMDMIITGCIPIEDPEGEKDPYLVLRGAVFNFKNDILPVDFCVKNPEGIKFFEDREISGAEPLFTKIWGKIINTTVYHEETEETAFGEAAIKKYERKSKEWIVTGTAKEPYEFGEEDVLTNEDIVKAMQNREIHLAEIKQQNEAYKASRGTRISNGNLNPTVEVFNF